MTEAGGEGMRELCRTLWNVLTQVLIPPALKKRFGNVGEIAPQGKSLLAL